MKTRIRTSNMFRVFLSLLFFIAIVLPTLAQDGGIVLPSDGTVEDVPGAPIDGFIGVAVAVGVYYGARKLIGSKKEN